MDLYLTLFGTTACGIAMAFVLTIQSSRSKNKLAKGLRLLKELRVLLSVTQQHRGLTTGYINGDKSLLPRIHSIHSHSQALILGLNDSSEWLRKNTNWKQLIFHWNEIASNIDSASTNSNLYEHNKLIQNLLYLIDDCAARYQLYSLKDGKNRSIQYLWKDLLSMTEYIGQTRAIGTGCLAANHCSSVERIRLLYLIQELAQLSNKEIASKLTLPSFIQMVEAEVMSHSQTLSATEYFDRATVVMSAVFDRFDQGIEHCLIEQVTKQNNAIPRQVSAIS
ncbi:hypothetical protein AB6E04_04170 [Vibrio amylolyticus]|uniref:hypothetical protein n=1 Tax=Vibrio amylolyticus TaxID=2847292 RepID=UPI0035503E17